MAPNKSDPNRGFFHTHTCLPPACPGHTRAPENSHACFHKPTPSPSPTSNTRFSGSTRRLPPFPNPTAGRTDSAVSNTPRAGTRSGVGPQRREASRCGREEAGKPSAPTRGAHPFPAPLPLHCASEPQAAAVPGILQASSALPPAGCSRRGRHTKPGEQAQRRQSPGRGSKRD